MNIVRCVWLYKEAYVLLTKHNGMTSTKKNYMSVTTYQATQCHNQQTTIEVDNIFHIFKYNK